MRDGLVSQWTSLARFTATGRSLVRVALQKVSASAKVAPGSIGKVSGAWIASTS